MKNPQVNLILIGGGGFALEIYSYILDEIQANKSSNLNVKGFLDDSFHCELSEKNPEVTHLGNISDYIVQDNDFGLIALGVASERQAICALLEEIGLPLYTFVHSTAYVTSNARLGSGVFIGPHCIVSAHSSLADNVALNVYCGVGHGAKIGKHSVMSPYSVLNGDCEIGEAVFLGSRVTLYPKTIISDYSVIDAGSIIREDIAPFSIVSQRVEQKILENRILKRKILGK